MALLEQIQGYKMKKLLKNKAGARSRPMAKLWCSDRSCPPAWGEQRSQNDGNGPRCAVWLPGMHRSPRWGPRKGGHHHHTLSPRSWLLSACFQGPLLGSGCFSLVSCEKILLPGRVLLLWGWIWRRGGPASLTWKRRRGSRWLLSRAPSFLILLRLWCHDSHQHVSVTVNHVLPISFSPS